MDKEIELSFFAKVRIGVACFFKALASSKFCQQADRLLTGSHPDASVKPPTPAPVQPVTTVPERIHASGLFMLSMLQREGRLIDFLQEDLASFSDADIGAAARVVHTGCRKAIQQCLSMEPVLKDSEGATVAVPAGYDAQRIRLTGNVTGQPPFKGELKHHGWAVTSMRLPSVSDTMDPKIIAPAEVELA